MIAIPQGFDITLLVQDLFSMAVPAVQLTFLFACGVLAIRMLKRA